MAARLASALGRRAPMVAALVALALAWAAGGAAVADEGAVEADEGPDEADRVVADPADPASAPDPPDLAFFAAPLVTYDSNYRLGGGGFGQLVFADPTGVEPFRASLSAQIYATLGGFQSHFVRWDLPGMFGSRFRFGGRVRRRIWTQATYYGLGNDAPRRDPAVDPDWHTWEQRMWQSQTSLRRSLRGSSWELYGGYDLMLLTVTRHADTLLETDRPQGASGGRFAWGQVGAFYDTRTDEVDPWDGITLDFAARTSGPWVGSEWVATGMHASWRGYWAPHHRVVLASRVLGDAVWGNPPFFTRPFLGGLSRAIVGGRNLLRGLPEERLRGDAIFAAQGEARFRLADVTVFRKVSLGLMLVPFVDAAQVLLWSEPDAGLDPHVTAGGGFRINANNLLIIRADVGVGVERYEQDPTRRPLLQVYVLSEHPF